MKKNNIIKVAEISANHNQSEVILNKILDKLLISESVNCIKLQAFTPDQCTSPHRDFKLTSGAWKGNSLYKLMQSAYTPENLLDLGVDRIKNTNKKLMLSINGSKDLQAIKKYKPDYIKLPSPESADVFLAKEIIKNGYKLVLSTGVIDDIELQYIKDKIVPYLKFKEQLTVLHCVSEYPTNLEKVNLRRLKIIGNIFKDNYIGISDHSLGSEVAISSVSMNISMIEKHVKLDEKTKSLDDQFSLTADEFLNFAKTIDNVEILLGDENYRKNLSSINGRHPLWQNRISTHAKINLESGRKLKESDFEFLRPGDGISPFEIEKFIGKELKTNINKGDPILPHYIF